MTSKFVFHKTFIVLVVAMLTTVVQAAPTATGAKKEPLQVKLEQFKVVVENGKENLISAERVTPGEVVEYRATYKNVSSAPIRNLVAIVPVPQGLEYQNKTATPAATAEATIDNVTFGSLPLMDAATKRPIPTQQYKSLRWKLQELAADKSIVVSARMKVRQQ